MTCAHMSSTHTTHVSQISFQVEYRGVFNVARRHRKTALSCINLLFRSTHGSFECAKVSFGSTYVSFICIGRRRRETALWRIKHIFIFDLHRALLDVQRALLQVHRSLFESEDSRLFHIYTRLFCVHNLPENTVIDTPRTAVWCINLSFASIQGSFGYIHGSLLCS